MRLGRPGKDQKWELEDGMKRRRRTKRWKRKRKKSRKRR